MKTSIALFCLALTACASRYDTSSDDYKQCDYEAVKATPMSGNAIADGMRQADLINRCMALKGH
jgi:hypothetical protein